MNSEWVISDLETWDERIQEIAKSYGLDWYPIVYEICDYYEMIGHMSYHGMPSHYNHWSFGKSFERTHQMYNLGMTGLPYELIINSNPSIAYLMQENPLYLQVLIMAHCIGHSDFFKNNRTFKDTNADNILTKMRSARKRVREYIEDPSIGIDEVERILDAAHSIQYCVNRNSNTRIPHDEQLKKVSQKIKEGKGSKEDYDKLMKIPIEKDYDILGFIAEHGRHLTDWERDIISIVRDSSLYFIPQIKTKILNEGWASFWHYKILHDLNLNDDMHLAFIKMHNQVVRPHGSQINPYHLGFYMFNRLYEEKGLDEIFFVREVHNDISALREYVDHKTCLDLGMYSYSKKEDEKYEMYVVSDVSNDEGWKNVKKQLIKNTGINSIPIIYVESMSKKDGLVLRHEKDDDRELDKGYAQKVLNHISDLWEDHVELITEVEGKEVVF